MQQDIDNRAIKSSQKNLKDLAINIQSSETFGKDNIPIIYKTKGKTATIQGNVVFETNHPCKGSKLVITYSAYSEVGWTEKSGRGHRDIFFSNKTRHGKDASKDGKLKLERPHPSNIFTRLLKKQNTRVSPGKYETEFEFDINHDQPSAELSHGWTTHKIIATLFRDSNKPITKEQKVWIMVSPESDSSNDSPNPDSSKGPSFPFVSDGLFNYPENIEIYSGVFEKKVPYILAIPKGPKQVGQEFPVMIELYPPRSISKPSLLTRESDFHKIRRKIMAGRNTIKSKCRNSRQIQEGDIIRVSELIASLKEYSWLSSRNTIKKSSQRILRRELREVNTIESEGSGGDISVKDMTIKLYDFKNEKPEDKFMSPFPEKNQRWRKFLMVRLPSIGNINVDVENKCLKVRHNFKLGLDVEVGIHPTTKLFIEAPIAIVAPQQAGGEVVNRSENDAILDQLYASTILRD